MAAFTAAGVLAGEHADMAELTESSTFLQAANALVHAFLAVVCPALSAEISQAVTFAAAAATSGFSQITQLSAPGAPIAAAVMFSKASTSVLHMSRAVWLTTG